MHKETENPLSRNAYAVAPEFAMVPLDAVCVDWTVHHRLELNARYVEAFVRAIASGDPLPPPIIFRNGNTYQQADGFHRFEAYRKSGSTAIEFGILVGTRRDAVEYAIRSNAYHGCKLSNKEKKLAVNTLLDDPEYHSVSDYELGEICGCSHTNVGRIRKAHPLTSTFGSDGVRKVLTKHSKRAEMRTRRIGRKQVRDDIAALGKGTSKSAGEPSSNLAGATEVEKTEAAASAQRAHAVDIKPSHDPELILQRLEVLHAIDAGDFARAVLASSDSPVRSRFIAIVDWFIAAIEVWQDVQCFKPSSSAQEVGDDR